VDLDITVSLYKFYTI